MPPLYICFAVVVMAWVNHPICCEAQLWDDMKDHSILINEGQQRLTGRPLSLVMKGADSSALDAFAIADNEVPRIGVDQQKLTENRKHRRGKQRRLRSRKHNDSQNDLDKSAQTTTEFNGPGRRICNTVTETNVLTEAINNYGAKVQIASGDGKNGIEAGLHFHESYCESERERCTAIDRSEYRSSCQTQYRYDYAPTISDGKIDLSLIKIRSGCNCIIQKKKRELYLNILGYIG